MRHRMMRRMMWLQMMRHGGPWGGPGMCWPGWGEPEISDEDRISMLEEYQRDLEQEVADVAERIKRLREEKANA